MRRTILPLSIILFIVTVANPCIAQITIDRTEFPRLETFSDTSILAVTGNIALPTEGPAQVWDYSSLIESELQIVEHFSAVSDANFPNALNYFAYDFYFQSFVLPSLRYEAIDNEGFYEPGRLFEDVIFSISSVSGGQFDSLRFVGGPDVYGGRLNYIKFPMTYEDQWIETRTEETHFELSVAAYGLDSEPGMNKRYITNEREVVGYGQLTIPNLEGLPGEPMNVLLLKVERSSIDSIFLSGEPAPAVLLNAFGLTQGQTASDNFYVFYRENYGSPVLNININSSGHTAYYQPLANSVITSENELNAANSTFYPNPVYAGGILTIETSNPVNSGSIILLDYNGREVAKNYFGSKTTSQVQFEIPVNLKPGIYFYQIRNAKGEESGMEKLMVK